MQSCYCIMRLSDFSGDELRREYMLMSPEKKARLDRMRDEGNRKRSAAGELLARRMIARFCGVDPESVIFGVGGRGKPYAVGLPADFSISHSGDSLICAIGDRAIGADTECLRPVSRRLIDYVCTDEEARYIAGAEDNDGRARRFLRIWTGKEAYFKRSGTGITDCRAVCVLDPLIQRDMTFFWEGDCTFSVCSAERPCRCDGFALLNEKQTR